MPPAGINQTTRTAETGSFAWASDPRHGLVQWRSDPNLNDPWYTGACFAGM